jgi:hypothetical protein
VVLAGTDRGNSAAGAQEVVCLADLAIDNLQFNSPPGAFLYISSTPTTPLRGRSFTY